MAGWQASLVRRVFRQDAGTEGGGGGAEGGRLAEGSISWATPAQITFSLTAGLKRTPDKATLAVSACSCRLAGHVNTREYSLLVTVTVPPNKPCVYHKYPVTKIREKIYISNKSSLTCYHFKYLIFIINATLSIIHKSSQTCWMASSCYGIRRRYIFHIWTQRVCISFAM